LDLALTAEARLLKPDDRIAALQKHIEQYHSLGGSFATTMIRTQLVGAMRDRGLESDYLDGLRLICEEHRFRQKQYGGEHPFTLVSIQLFLLHLVEFAEKASLLEPGDAPSRVTSVAAQRSRLINNLMNAQVGQVSLKADIQGLENGPSGIDLVRKIYELRVEIFGRNSRPAAAALALRARIHLILGEYGQAGLIARSCIDSMKGFAGNAPALYRARSRVIIAAAARGSAARRVGSSEKPGKPAEKPLSSPKVGKYAVTEHDIEVLHKNHDHPFLRRAQELGLPIRHRVTSLPG
jgi:hypothetical protein